MAAVSAPAPADERTAGAEGRGSGAAAPRRAWWAAPLAAATAFAVAIATTVRNGFNPTDEGLIVAYAHELLAGRVPHRDLVFSRPMGSSLLHLVDLALPTPLLLTGRALGAAEIFAFTALLACLVVGCRLRDAPAWLWAAIGVAALVNVHTMPLMAWYTVDGLVLFALGAHLLRHGERPWVRGVALVLLGCAPLCKQSFFLAPVVGLWLLWRHRRGDLADRAGWARTLGLLALPGLAYALWITAAGGLGDMVEQFTGVPGVYGAELGTAIADLGDGGQLALGLATSAAGWAAVHVAGRRPVADRVAVALAVGGAVAVAIPVVLLVATEKLSLAGSWSAQLWWLAVLAVGATAVRTRRLAEGATLTVVAGWMAALSIGYPRPGLTAGSLALATLVLGARPAAEVVGSRRAPGADHTSRRSRPPWPAAGAVAVVVLVAGLPLMAVRNAHPYRDLPADRLTYDLGAVAPALAGLRTNEVTGSYLAALRDCAVATGAERIAVVPDNPAAAAVFGLDAPLPLDSLYPQEWWGSEERLVEAFAELDRSPVRTAVLWQVVAADGLRDLPELPQATEATEPFTYDDATLEAAFDATADGERSSCGPFIVTVWDPGDGR